MADPSSLKVLFLTSSYPRNMEDSASVFLRHLAQNLQLLGITIHVLAPADTVAGTFVESGIFVHRFRYFPKRWQSLAYGSGILPNLRADPLRWAQTPFFAAAMLLELARLVRRHRPNVIHAHWAIPQGLLGLLVSIVLRTPLITTIHGTDAFAFRSGMLARVREWVIKRSNAWTANTQATGRAACTSADDRRYIIPMGVRVADFARGQRSKLRTTVPGNSQVILFVGRLVDVKGADDLVTAFSLITPRLLKNCQLWVVGDGINRGLLERQAEALGVAGQTRFFGAVPNHALPDYYAAADLCVVPSVQVATNETEAQGVVLLEAFSAKKCVVATNTGGIPEILEDLKTGILVPPRSPQQLARAIERLLTDEALRFTLADNAFMTVQAYDWHLVAERFAVLYRSVAREQARSSSPRQSIDNET